MTTAQEVVRNLSAFNKHVIKTNGYATKGRFQYSALLINPLVREGIFERIERKGFKTVFVLTEFGRQVKSYLNLSIELDTE